MACVMKIFSTSMLFGTRGTQMTSFMKPITKSQGDCYTNFAAVELSHYGQSICLDMSIKDSNYKTNMPPSSKYEGTITKNFGIYAYVCTTFMLVIVLI
jgi:hypothetical protein